MQAAEGLYPDLTIASQGHCFTSGALNHLDGPRDGTLSVGGLVGASQFSLRVCGEAGALSAGGEVPSGRLCAYTCDGCGGIRAGVSCPSRGGHGQRHSSTFRCWASSPLQNEGLLCNNLPIPGPSRPH